MELKEFIKMALVDIVEGVSNAKKVFKDKNDCICPPTKLCHLASAKLVRDGEGLYLQKIEFDVAVTTENTNSKGGRAGIKVFGVEANLGKDVNSTSASISRIKFQVPIGLSSRVGHLAD